MVKPLVVAVLIAFSVLTATQAQANLLSDDDRRAYRAAFAAAQEGEWHRAHVLGKRAKDKLLAKVLKYLDYARIDTQASFTEIADFVRENPDWPQPQVLARRAEEAMSPTEPAEAMMAWFVEHPPQTPNGKMAWARVLFGAGRPDKAAQVLRDAWIQDNFGLVQERQFLDLHRAHLRREDHQARLDRLLWDRQVAAARRMMPRVDAAYQQLAEARLALIDAKGVEHALARVPAELRGDPGLLFERVRWRRKKDFHDEAVALLSSPAADKGRPELWWVERSILAREALERGRKAEAYAIANKHGKVEGSQFADAQWLSGWIALRFLNNPSGALAHFKRMYDQVTSPISRARGAYWAGRAEEAQSHAKEAETWYRVASEAITSYYGQLAAGRLNVDHNWPLPDDPLPTSQDIEDFGRHELARAAGMLAEIEARDHIRSFVYRLGELATTPGQHALAAKLAATSGRPDVAVSLARKSAQSGVILVASSYPVLNFSLAEPPEKALVLSIIRQESNFHQHAVSVAGARGLMQLLPTTAKQVSLKAGGNFTPQRLTSDPDYNVALGSVFLRQLVENFDGSYVLAIASYNAGPARVRSWIRNFGDPRESVVDAVDWVEMIPFGETRNYVQRVLEGLQIYRRRLGATEFKLSLEGDLKR